MNGFDVSRAKLATFVEESNRVEGIRRAPTAMELHAHEHLLELPQVAVHDLEIFVGLISDGKLRDRKGRDVRVGSYRPPPGDPLIRAYLELLLAEVNHTGDKEWPGHVPTPYAAHCRYETLHPFTDGNGRSGRALWLWQMLRLERNPFIRSFLHGWYYDSLGANRGS